jgi:hypothetical protein
MGRIRSAAAVVALVAFCGVSPTVASSSVFEPPAFAERELVGLRTAESRTWEMPSGRRVTQVTTEPVQWRDDQGGWHDYDLSLRTKGGEGWEAHTGGVAIELPAALGRSGEDIQDLTGMLPFFDPTKLISEAVDASFGRVFGYAKDSEPVQALAWLGNRCLAGSPSSWLGLRMTS